MFDFLAETLAGDNVETRCGTTSEIHWFRPEVGVMIFEPKGGYEKNIVISVAIHGNETAPIEIINHLITAILSHQYTLNVRLMVILGNVEAMRSNERYLNVDLNRLFSDHYLRYEPCYETKRAAILQQVVSNFYAIAPEKPKFHFDLHTAIRASRHVAFGLLPYRADNTFQSEMITWLQSVGLEALVVNHAPAATFSYFSSHQFGANSCTLELGKAMPFGQNNLQQFSGIDKGLIDLITEKKLESILNDTISVYKVADVIIKLSDQFSLNVSDDAENFTEFPKGYVIASDYAANTNSQVNYTVKNESGYILFPNANVKNGLRAGLLLAKSDLADIST